MFSKEIKIFCPSLILGFFSQEVSWINTRDGETQQKTSQDSWFTDPDFKTWLKKPKSDHYLAECALCPGAKISISSMGRRALTSHMLGQKHKIKADAMKKSPAVSIFFQSGMCGKLSQPSSKPNAPEMPSTSMPSTSSAGIPSTSSGIPSTTSSSSSLPVTPI